MLGTIKKQPREIIDVDIDFDLFLPDTDIIISVFSVPDTPTLVIPISDIVENNKVVKVWLTEGIDSIDYKVTTIVTTSKGRIIEVEFKVKVKEL